MNPKAIGNTIFFTVDSEEDVRTAKIGDTEIVISNIYTQKEKVVRTWGTITSVSDRCRDEYQEGDIIGFHHNTLFDENNVEGVYQVDKANIYYVIRNGELSLRNGIIFYDRIEVPEKTTASGILIIDKWKPIEEDEMFDRNMSPDDAKLGNWKEKEYLQGEGIVTHTCENEYGIEVGTHAIWDKKFGFIETKMPDGSVKYRFPIHSILAIK